MNKTTLATVLLPDYPICIYSNLSKYGVTDGMMLHLNLHGKTGNVLMEQNNCPLVHIPEYGFAWLNRSDVVYVDSLLERERELVSIIREFISRTGVMGQGIDPFVPDHEHPSNKLLARAINAIK